MARPQGTSCSIFVGNVPYDAQEDELRELFGKVGAGAVTSVRVVCDKDTKQPKGYAFCDFAEGGAVHSAIEKLNNIEYKGRRLRVDWAERELHTPVSSKALEDRTPPRPSSSGGPGADIAPVPAPVPSVADRLARLREQEAAEQARDAAADASERAEIARLMETLTPTQIFHILGEMQRLALRAPEVARALVSENLQLCLALQHAQFLVGMVSDAPLPSEPEVKERARNIREKVWPANTVMPARPIPTSADPALAEQLQAKARSMVSPAPPSSALVPFTNMLPVAPPTQLQPQLAFPGSSTMLSNTMPSSARVTLYPQPLTASVRSA